MTRLLTFILGLFFLLQTSCNQNATDFNKVKLSDDDKLKFAASTDLVIQSKSWVLYFVAKDKQTIVASENGKIIWQNNIISTLGKPYVGQPEVRNIRLDNDTLNVIFGKHDFARVDIHTGKATYLGAD